MKRYLSVALGLSLAVAAGAFCVVRRDTIQLNATFRTDHQKFARKIYEIRYWHPNELPQYATLSHPELVAALLSEYSSLYELDSLIQQADRNRRPSAEVPKLVEIDLEDTIRIDPDLPGPTEQAKLTRAEKKYWAAVQLLSPEVWAYQRSPAREGLAAAFRFLLGTFAALLAIAFVFVFVFRPVCMTIWRTLMRALNDVSNALRGKFRSAPPN